MSKPLYRLFLRKLAADIHGIALGLDEYPPIARVVLESERQDFPEIRFSHFLGVWYDVRTSLEANYLDFQF